MEQERIELVDTDGMRKMFNIPRGSINKLINQKGFPRSMRATGTKFRYFLVSAVEQWIKESGHLYKRKPRKTVKVMVPTVPTLNPPTLPKPPNATTELRVTYTTLPPLFTWGKTNVR